MYRIASFLKLVTLVILCTVFAAVIARTELSAAQLTLSWSDNSNNEDGFRVERKNRHCGNLCADHQPARKRGIARR